MADAAAPTTSDVPSDGEAITAPPSVLGAYEVWADYLRLTGISVWLVWTLVFKREIILLWAPLLGTFAMSVVAVVITRKALFPAWGRPVLALVNVFLLTYFVWAVGAESTTLTVFYVPLVVAVTMVGSPTASRVAVSATVLTYSATVLLQAAHMIPVAPLVRPVFRHEHVAGGPMLSILSVTTAVLGSYAFVLLARRRMEKQAATEKQLRLAQQAAETETRALQRQLELSQRMEGLGRLAGGVAHDFNNVLTAMVNNITLARDELEPSSPAHEDLGEALQCASRAAGVVRQVLAFSHRDAGDIAVVHPDCVVAGAQNLLSRAIGPEISFEIHTEPDAPCVLIDPLRLEQILLNLAVNARDAMNGRGKITISVARQTLDSATAQRWPELELGVYARIDFQDDGVGMDEATLAKAFLPFFTTKPKGQGTGIGLSIVFSIVRTSKGAVRLESGRDKGTTVSIMLPATAEAPASVVLPARKAASVAGTILLVEDQDDVRRATLRLLERRGYQVLCACSGEEALELVSRREGAIDLLLTDVVMPGISGLTLANQLLERSPDLRVILMSGHPEDDFQDVGSMGQAMQFVGKPFEPSEMLERIAVAIGRVSRH